MFSRLQKCVQLTSRCHSSSAEIQRRVRERILQIERDGRPPLIQPETPRTTPFPQPDIEPITSNITATEGLPFADNFGRGHNYLRISLTERCNLRCVYCMPEEGVPLKPHSQLLHADEIIRLVKLFASYGVDKVRLTGGEPTVRPDLVDIISRIREVDGIQDVGLTSNGIVLGKSLQRLKDAGLNKVNISLDTLDSQKFIEMTRRNGLKKVMDCILHAEQIFTKVKVNTVVMRDFNDQEIPAFVDLTKDRNVDVRFIEFMPFGGNNFDKKKFVDYRSMLAMLDRDYGGRVERLQDHPNDTTKAYKIAGHRGQFGFITSMSDHFCDSCNRLRLTADGNLKVCLHGNAEVSLRDVMRRGCSDRELANVIAAAVQRKKRKHAGMENLQNLPNRPMILIGG